MNQTGGKNVKYYLLIIFLTISIFLTDIVIPRGHNEWVLYYIPVYLLSLTNRLLIAYLLTILISILLYIGAILSPSGIPLWSSLLNRTAALFTLWIMVLILRSRAKTLKELKKSTLELFKSRQWLERIIDATPDIIFIFNVQKDHITYCNNQVVSVLGYSQKELLSMSKMTIEHPEDVDDVKKFYYTFSKEHIDSVRESIHRIRHKNGTYRFVQVRALPFSHNPDGTVNDVVGIIHDITENRKNEEALRESEKNYRQLIETSNSIVIRWDNKGTIYYINDFGLRFFGYTRDELIGKEVEKIIPVAEKGTEKNISLLVNDILKHPEMYTSIPFENIKKNGEIVWVAWTNSAIVNDNGVVKEILAIGNDITELKNAQNELSERTALLDAAIDAIADGLVIYDNQGRIIRQNRVADKIFRYSEEEHIKPIEERIKSINLRTKKDEPMSIEDFPSIRAIKKLEIIRNVEMIITNRIGQTFILNASAAPIIYKDGSPRGAVGTFFDMTLLYNLEQQREALLKETQESRYQLEKLNENLESIISQRTEQVRSLSKALTLAEFRERKRFSQVLHENLQQVLFGIKIQVEQIKPEKNDLEKCPEHTSEIQYSLRLIEKALKIVRSMSTELNPPILKTQGLDIALSWLSAHMRRTYNLTVDLKLSKTVQNVRDEVLIMLIQIVRELLTNTVKHSGVLQASLEAICQNGLITIKVSDSGSGFVVDDINKRQKDEIRMGLFSVEERIKLFGGTFSIDSQPGHGTTCKITLPYENC
jgi:PAS domain S-box-containing protein